MKPKVKTVRKRVEKSAGWDKLWLQSLESKLVGDSISEPYTQHQTVFMILDALASCMPTVEFKIYRGDNEVTEGPIVDLFMRPNSRMCRFQLWEATVLFYAYYGEAFWTFSESIGQVTGASKIPSEIWVRNPTKFNTVIRNGQFLGFRFMNTFLPSEELIQFSKFNMFDDIRGFSPITPIKSMLDMDYKAQLYNRSFFNNSAELNGYVSTGQELSDKAYERLVRQFENRHKGPQNSHKLGILENDLKYTSATETHKDMEFLEQRRYTREELLGIWRVPKFMFSVTDNLNYATARAAKRIFWENSIIPILKYVEEKLNAFFFFQRLRGYEGFFDFSNVPELQEDFTSKVDNAVKLASIGIPLQQINDRLDLGFDILEEPKITETFNTQEEEPKKEEPRKANQIDKQKRLLLLHMDRVIEPIQRSIFKKMKTYLFDLRKEVLEGVNKSFAMKQKGIEFLVRLDWNELNKKLKNKLKPEILKGIFIGTKTAQQVLRNKLDDRLFKPKVLSLIQEKLDDLGMINGNIKKSLTDILNEGLSAGSGVKEISEEIKKYFNLSEMSARRVAQTETIGAYNAGNHLYYKESGVKKKRWLCTRDDKTRDTHRWDTPDGVDGEIVDIDKNFSNGVDYPGGNGPAEEIINCRCTIIPELEA